MNLINDNKILFIEKIFIMKFIKKKLKNNKNIQ